MPETSTKTQSADIWSRLKSEDASALGDRLHWHPSHLENCVEARAEKLPPPLNAEELEELREAHRRWGADEASLASIEKLGSPNARVVCTGQQPTPLAGPMYVAYKTLAAVDLARTLGRKFPHLDFVPVFWTASEDHDFAEVRKIFWPATGGSLEEVFLNHPDAAPGRMIGTLPVLPLAEQLLARIEKTTHETEFRRDVLALLREAFAEGQTWEDAFCRIYLRLSRGTGVAVVSPLMRWLRRRSVAILHAEADGAASSSQRVIERGRELEAAGLPAALHRRPDAVNMFWIDDRQCRHAISVGPRGFEIASAAGNDNDARETLAADAATLKRRIEAEPERFSLNVVTRPLVQDAALPTVAQVVGPGEAAYLAQVEAVYDAFSVFAPVRWPRPRATLVAQSVARALDKYGLAAAEALDSDAMGLARRVIEDDESAGVLRQLNALKKRHEEDLEKLRAEIGDDPAVGAALDKLRQAMEKGHQTLRERILSGRQRDEQHLNRAMQRIETGLKPGGNEQERTLNPVVPFMILHGPDWASRLALRLDNDFRAGPQTIFMRDLAVE